MFDPTSFANEWIALWNAQDAEAVVGHYADECIFVSPKAAAITGNGQVHGKEALRAYWTAALARSGTLRFQLDRVLWDPAARTVSVIYDSTTAAGTVRACEVMQIDASGKVRRGEALYGAPISGA